MESTHEKSYTLAANYDVIYAKRPKITLPKMKTVKDLKSKMKDGEKVSLPSTECQSPEKTRNVTSKTDLTFTSGVKENPYRDESYRDYLIRSSQSKSPKRPKLSLIHI